MPFNAQGDPAERWVPVSGYEGLYEVSSLGSVRSLDRVVTRGSSTLRITGRVMRPDLNPNGYNYIRLTKGGNGKLVKLAKIVCEAFTGPRPLGKQVAHRNGCRTDDREQNLTWLTRSENEGDKLIHGTRPFGEQLHNATISHDQAGHIRRLRSRGATYKQIASAVECSFEAVRGVCARNTYPEAPYAV